MRVNVHHLLREHFHTPPAVARAFVDGGLVTIDGHVVRPEWARGHWDPAQVAGRMLAITGTGVAHRILGSRAISKLEPVE